MNPQGTSIIMKGRIDDTGPKIRLKRENVSCEIGTTFLEVQGPA